MSEKRFRVEERSGIVAVYDTGHAQYSYLPGCHRDYPWTVCSWDGTYNDDKRHWEVAQEWINKAHSTCKLLNDLHERATKQECAIPAGMDAHGLTEARAKLNPALGMPESRGNVETGDLHKCPCPACGRVLVDLWGEGDRLHAGYEFHCDHCNARLRVEYATVTLSEEAGRANR